MLIGLAAGSLVGLGVAHSQSPAATAIVSVAAPIGTIFINLIRMTVIPLVVSMLVASVGSMAASRALGRAGWRAAALALVLLVMAASIALAIARPVLAAWPIDASAATTVRHPLAAAPVTVNKPGESQFSRVAQWAIDLVPDNVVKAAAEGAMLPVIVFALLFGVALSRVGEARRVSVLRVADGVAEVMQRLVAGILELAPIGVFALAVPLVSRLGVSVAGALVAYVALVVALTVLVGVVLIYPVGILAGPMSAREFIAFCAPAQAVAFASRSSLAALPAMVETAERARLPAVVSGFVLPIAASVFRLGAAVAQTVGVLFLARLYGMTLSAPELATVAFTVVITTFAVPGIPGGSIIAMTPVLAAVHLPIEGIGILLAVDTIPDMFRTTENVTGSMTLAAVLARSSHS